MLKLLLVNPPNGRLDRTYLAPPLGLLTLAASVRRRGHRVSVIDFNLEVLADPSLGGGRFYDAACEMVARAEPDVVGFTSMCLESHVSLELARRVKAALPGVRTVFGGTHFGAVAREVLENFPFADFVVRGEADDALPALLDYCSGGGDDPSALPGNVLYRRQGEVLGGATREAAAPHLEELPFPAYDLVDLERYFALNPARLMNYEAGRGCVFKCSFCYSPFQYGDAVRNKEPARVVEDLRRLSELGARHVFFVQDNLLNSPRWAAELCRRVADADLPLTWECYVTYPQLKEPLIDLLAEAKCRGVFTGIDAVAGDAQERMNKRFLRDWEAVSRKLSYCLDRGIQPLCAFILEEPGQDPRRNGAVVHTALRCLSIGCEVHLNTLSVYNATALDRGSPRAGQAYAYTSAKAELLMDTPEVVRVNEFARRFPELFPYHSVVGEVKSWEVFVAKVYTLSSLLAGLRRTLFQYVVEEGNTVWPALDYIDEDFLARLRSLEPRERREAAVLEFYRHFSSQDISRETMSLLSREVAGMLLSKNRAGRSVSLSTGPKGGREYRLAWFLDLQRLDAREAQSAPPPAARRSSRRAAPADAAADARKFALLSRANTIKVFSASPELTQLLLGLEDAANLRGSVRLSAAEVEGLLRDGWIWEEAPEQAARAGDSPSTRPRFPRHSGPESVN